MPDDTKLPVIVPQSPVMSLDTMMRLAESVAKSGMFGIKTADQALVLMSIAQAEGRHPALAARDYHIIQGAPAKKAEAMARDFLSAGGRIEWHKLDDEAADATFSHPSGGSARITWDQARVAKAGLGSNPMHRKFPRQMLRSRVVSEGVRTVWPMATSGMYVPEEFAEFRPRQSEPIDITPPHDAETGEVIEDAPGTEAPIDAGDEAADGGTDNFVAWWNSASVKPHRGEMRHRLEGWRVLAQAADERGGPAPDEEEDPFGLPPLGAPTNATGTPPASEAPAPSTGPPAAEQPHSAPRGGAADHIGGVNEMRPDPVIDPAPGKAGKPDWRAWSAAQFQPKLRQKLTTPDLADFLGANAAHLDEAKRKLDAADCRDLNAAISAQWDRVGAAEKAGS